MTEELSHLLNVKTQQPRKHPAGDERHLNEEIQRLLQPQPPAPTPAP
ncbi:MAG: hypothetical protein NTV49_06725 [Kiritimatiellaeota bacterium]|nr:hypothetical protein [Kiritimatiellota bacterium]